MNLKRLRDVTNKRVARAKGPSGQECQIRVDINTMNMYIYDKGKWIEYTQNIVNDGMTYGSHREIINSDDEMGVYDTSEPTDAFTWESGDEVSYVFKNWDGTVLKEGKVDEGTAPTPPEDPTRPADADYVYTFAGWNPEVSTITKKTVYTATYTREDRLYIEINDELSDTTGTVGGQVTVYFSTVGNPGVLYSDDPDILTVVDTDTTGGEGWTNKVTYSVGGTGTTTATITVTKNGQTASDSIQITCSEATVAQEGWAETATVNNEEVQVRGVSSTKRCTYNYTSSAELNQDTTAFNVSVGIVPSNATIDVDNDLDFDSPSGATVTNVAISNGVLSFTIAPETTWEDESQAHVTVMNINADAPTFNVRINISYESNE